MSDTSDYTIVGDTSPSPSLSAHVQAPASTAESSPSPDGYKLMGNTVSEITEMMQIIRNSIFTLYEAAVDSFKGLGSSDARNKYYAAKIAGDLVHVLETFGEMVATLPEEGYVETAELLVDILLEASSMLAAEDQKESHDAMCTHGGVFIYKCVAQAQVLASHSRYPAQAKMLHEPVAEEAIRNALNFHLHMNRSTTRSAARVFRALLPRYMRSLTAIYGCASAVSYLYVDYATSVLSELDKGEQGKAGEKTEKTEIKIQGWRLREWCSSFWR
ncbi:hypothetical protein SCUCBS95973_001366 [Sporothrix curviconia]|uniref:Uncharacterized protein n=1 Tax=Sporothrix curviconia TaxID=1260050 RepID=A0ABP0AY46_9PEZI